MEQGDSLNLALGCSATYGDSPFGQIGRRRAASVKIYSRRTSFWYRYFSESGLSIKVILGNRACGVRGSFNTTTYR